MKLIDVIHFYLGCQCVDAWFPSEHEQYEKGWKLLAIDIESPKPYGLNNGEFDTWTAEIKPILRPLSSMTEEEMKEIWKIIFHRDFVGNNIIWFNKESNSSAKRWVLSSGVERLGIEMTGHIWADSDLHHFKYNPYFTTQYLLSKHFDLFNLIESGQALDATTQPQ
jgi:hypothetical protein